MICEGVISAALHEVHGLAVADGARGALLIRQQPLPEQPVRLLQVTCLPAMSRVNAVLGLAVADGALCAFLISEELVRLLQSHMPPSHEQGEGSAGLGSSLS